VFFNFLYLFLVPAFGGQDTTSASYRSALRISTCRSRRAAGCMMCGWCGWRMVGAGASNPGLPWRRGRERGRKRNFNSWKSDF